jgi:hypothetical protein
VFPSPFTVAAVRANHDASCQHVATIRRTLDAAGVNTAPIPDLANGGVARPDATIIASDVPCRLYAPIPARPGEAAGGDVPAELERIAFAVAVDVQVGDVLTIAPAPDAGLAEAPRTLVVSAAPGDRRGRAFRTVMALPPRPGQLATLGVG